MPVAPSQSYVFRYWLLNSQYAGTMLLVALIVDHLAVFDRLPNSTRAIMMNIGSNIDPVQVDRETTHYQKTAVIAFEPIVPHLIPESPNLFVVPAAVAAEDGVAMMLVLGRSLKWVGSSSSLAALSNTSYSPTAKLLRSQPKGMAARSKGTVRVVPIISMRGVMASLPHLPCLYLKTDMQGYDFSSLASVGNEILRFQYLRTEVYLSRSMFIGVQNDFCKNWLPHMTHLGFTLVGLIAATAKGAFTILPENARASCQLPDYSRSFKWATEGDAFWANPIRSVSRPPVLARNEWPFPRMTVTHSPNPYDD